MCEKIKMSCKYLIAVQQLEDKCGESNFEAKKRRKKRFELDVHIAHTMRSSFQCVMRNEKKKMRDNKKTCTHCTLGRRAFFLVHFHFTRAATLTSRLPSCLC